MKRVSEIVLVTNKNQLSHHMRPRCCKPRINQWQFVHDSFFWDLSEFCGGACSIPSHHSPRGSRSVPKWLSTSSSITPAPPMSNVSGSEIRTFVGRGVASQKTSRKLNLNALYMVITPLEPVQIDRLSVGFLESVPSIQFLTADRFARLKSVFRVESSQPHRNQNWFVEPVSMFSFHWASQSFSRS